MISTLKFFSDVHHKQVVGRLGRDKQGGILGVAPAGMFASALVGIPPLARLYTFPREPGRNNQNDKK
jgi:hypothetical protein